MSVRVSFDAEGAVTPPLKPDESLCCLSCSTVIEREQVDEWVGQTVRECGTATCFMCDSRQGFERITEAARPGSVARRWGTEAAGKGWTPMPHVLLDSMKALELRPVDLMVVLAIESYRYMRTDAPAIPRMSKVAARAGVCLRTARSSLERLERAGLIEVHPARRANGSKTTNGYTCVGLRRALDFIATSDAAPGEIDLSDLRADLARQGEQRYRFRVSPNDWQRKTRPAKKDAA